jgi:ABC-type nickel/cobalt efflux system permease component RcnA
MVIWLSQAIAPDRILPWLTLASGALLVVAGVSLLVRRLVLGQHGHVHLFSPDAHDHGHGSHDHGHEHALAHAHAGHAHGHEEGHLHGGPAHDHGPHGHHHDHDHDGHRHAADAVPAGAPSRRFLVLMGVAGGLVPTTSALVVLLGATALGKPWFGVILVAIYGLGMSASLMGAGLLMVRLQSWMERQFLGKPWWQTALRLAPVITSIVLCVGGLTIALRGATAL